MNQLQDPQNSHLCDLATAKLLPVEQLSLQGLLDFPISVQLRFGQLLPPEALGQPLARSLLPTPTLPLRPMVLRLTELSPPPLLSGFTPLQQEPQQPLGH